MANSLDIIRFAFERLPKVENPVRAKQMMDSIYDVKMGLITLEELVARPMATVRLFDAEKQTFDIGVEARLRMYAKAQVPKYFLCAPHEFLRYPRRVIEMILRICKEMSDLERHETSDQRKQFEQIAKGLAVFQAQGRPPGQSPPGPGTTGG